MIRRSGVALAALALLGATVACGDDGDDPTADDAEEAAAEGSAQTGDEADSTGDDSDGAATEDTGAAASGRSFDGNGSDEFCAALTDLRDASADEPPAPEETGEILASLERLDAPPEIVDEWATFLRYIGEMTEAAADGEAPPMEDEGLEEFAAASEVVEDYMGQVCGL